MNELTYNDEQEGYLEQCSKTSAEANDKENSSDDNDSNRRVAQKTTQIHQCLK